MNIWKGNTKKIKKASSGGVVPATTATGGSVAAAEGTTDDGLPDVLAGHAMLAHQDHSATRTTSWQQQQQHPLHEQNHPLYQPQQHQASSHLSFQCQPQYSSQQQQQQQQQSQSLFPNLQVQQQQRQPHPHQQHQKQQLQQQQQQQQQQSYTPLGLGAHSCEWRNDGGGYQENPRGFNSQYTPSFQDAEPSSRYNQLACSYSTLESESKHRYYHSPTNPATETETHFNLRHYGTHPENAENRYISNYVNPSDTDGRYLAIPVSDASTAFVPQSSVNVEEARVSFNNLQVADQNATVRYRSMSSEPRAGRKDAESRRVRCSSANRVRQTRSRTFQASSPSASSPVASPIASPPQTTSPPPPQVTSSPSAVAPVQSSSQTSHTSAVSTEPRHWDPCASSSATALENPSDDRSYGLSPPVSSSTGNYGYQVEDLEALLSHSSANQPANLPMVLASPTRLHHMRRTQTNAGPSRPFLPLGVIVNAVFKTRDWLYVRTAHGAEGFVPYHVCLPLGILPTKPSPATTEAQAPAAAWEMQEAPVQRGRCRERRRAPGPASANQTDLQKLHPMSRPSAPVPRDTTTQPQLQSYQQGHQASGSRN